MARPERLKFGFWIAAGSQAGGGHAHRVLGLVEELESRGHRCRVAADDAHAVARATGGRLPAFEATPDQFTRWLCDGWVVDRPHTNPATAEVLGRLRASTKLLLCFDSNDPERVWCDLHVSAVPRASGRDSSRCLWGPRYAVVPERESGTTRRHERGILFAFGAADPARLSEAAIDVAEELRADFETRLIVGPLLPQGRRAALRARAEAAGVELLVSPPDVAHALAGAKVAVLSFGQMLLEALAHGTSVAMWHPSREHAEVGRRFAALCGDWPCREVGWGIAAARRVGAVVRRLAVEPQPATPPVDGRGAARIVDAIEAAIVSGARLTEAPAPLCTETL